MNSNNLSKLHENFKELTELRSLNIAFNNLISLPTLPRSLRKLDAQHNKLSKWKDVEEVVGLRYLNLSFNKLSVLDNLSHLSELRVLELSYNDLKVMKLKNLYYL